MKNTTLALAMLAATLVYAADTRVLSYDGMIDDAMHGRPIRSQEVLTPDDQRKEQERWDSLSREQQQDIMNKRMDKRENALKSINMDLVKIDKDKHQVEIDQAKSDEPEKYRGRLEELDYRKTLLLDLKDRIERTPEGENVDMTGVPTQDTDDRGHQ